MGSQIFRQSKVLFFAFYVLSASVQASTVPPSFEQAQPQDGDFSLSDLVAKDDLGYTCVPENRIDDAFFATGKGIRLPQTCLPKPCELALSEFQLASLIGRPPSLNEWDDYFSRYADVCRKEITPLEQDEPLPGDVPVREDSVEGFWGPLLAGFAAPPLITARTTLVSDPTRRNTFNPQFGPLTSGSTRRPVPETPGQPKDPPFVFEKDKPIPMEPESNQPLPVPLPAALGFLFVSICSLFVLKARPSR